MCVAAPATVVAIERQSGLSIPATVAIGDVHHAVDLVMVPDAEVGDIVIVHSGYAISIVAPDDAQTRMQWMGLG